MKAKEVYLMNSNIPLKMLFNLCAQESVINNTNDT